MGPTNIILFISAAFLLSCLLTFFVTLYAKRRSIIDIPNERSSHTNPTPRGGGLAFVSVFLFGISFLTAIKALDISLAIAIVGGGLIVATCGFLDDKKGLSVKIRIVCHIAAGCWVVYWLGGLPNLNLGTTSLPLAKLGGIIALFIVVWMINLYNFMDGIDGIAGSEAITVAAAAALLLYLHANSTQLLMPCILLGSSVAGFLVWNWSPARIFMGDVGSCFLGFIFAVFMIFSENSGYLPLIAWLTLLSIFIVDATLTLIKRIVNREKWYEAHRRHLYQLAVQRGYTHHQVVLIVILLNIVLALITETLFTPSNYLMVKVSIIMMFLCFLYMLLRKRFDSYGKFGPGVTGADKVLEQTATVKDDPNNSYDV